MGKIANQHRLIQETPLSLALLAIFISANLLMETSIPIARLSLRCVELSCVACLCILEMLQCQRYSSRELIAIIVIIVLGAQVVAHGGFALFEMASLGFLFRNQNVRSIASCMFVTICFWLVVIPILSYVDIVPNLVVEATSQGRQARQSFGFAWPSKIQTYLLTILLLYYLIRGQNASPFVVALLCAVASFVFLQTDVKLSFVLTLLVASAGAVLMNKRNANPITGKWRWLLYSIVVGAFVICVICMVGFDSNKEAWSALNKLLSGRLELSSVAVRNRALTLFGDTISIHQSNEPTSVIGYFDSGFLNVLYSFGVVPLIVILCAFTIGLKKCVDSNLRYEVLNVAVFVMVGMFYSHMFFSISYSIAPILIAQAILRDRNCDVMHAAISSFPKHPMKLLVLRSMR